MVGLDISAIWKDVTPIASGGMDQRNSLLESVFLEFQDGIGRRSSSAPRNSSDDVEN